MLANVIFGSVAGLSLGLGLWQWLVARRFPLHQRPASAEPFPSAVTLFKPLKGCDEHTEACLRSWLTQSFTGRVQALFGVADPADPVCPLVQRLMAEFPHIEAELVIAASSQGANAKVATLAALEQRATHDLWIISDADVLVPPDCLSNLTALLREPEVGLVNCFYRLANASTWPMRWEAVAINADFWSQVLQAQSLRPVDFALGAVMATRRARVVEIGGFGSLADCLADDYQLGHRIFERGHRILLSTVVVECWGAPMNWSQVWNHQLRWARTVRVCQPVPYFFSILSNATFWPGLWACLYFSPWSLGFALACFLVRMITAIDLQNRLERSRTPLRYAWLAWWKDVAQVFLWVCAFGGNQIEWRGRRMRLKADGTLVPL